MAYGPFGATLAFEKPVGERSLEGGYTVPRPGSVHRIYIASRARSYMHRDSA